MLNFRGRPKTERDVVSWVKIYRGRWFWVPGANLCKPMNLKIVNVKLQLSLPAQVQLLLGSRKRSNRNLEEYSHWESKQQWAWIVHINIFSQTPTRFYGSEWCEKRWSIKSEPSIRERMADAATSDGWSTSHTGIACLINCNSDCAMCPWRNSNFTRCLHWFKCRICRC